MSGLNKLIVSFKLQKSALSICAVLIGAAISSQLVEVNYSLVFYCCLAACLVQATYGFLKILGYNYARVNESAKVKSKKSFDELKYTMVLLGLLSAFFIVVCIIKAQLTYIESIVSLLIIVLPLGALSLYVKNNYKWSYNRLVDMFFLVFYTYITIFMSLYVQCRSIAISSILFSTAYVLMRSCILNINSIKNFHRDQEQGNNTLPTVIGSKSTIVLQLLNVVFVHLLMSFYYLSQKNYIYTLIILIIMVGSIGNNLRLTFCRDEDYKYILRDQIISTLALGFAIVSRYFFEM